MDALREPEAFIDGVKDCPMGMNVEGGAWAFETGGDQPGLPSVMLRQHNR